MAMKRRGIQVLSDPIGVALDIWDEFQKKDSMK